MISIDAVISTDAAISSGAEATLISPACHQDFGSAHAGLCPAAGCCPSLLGQTSARGESYFGYPSRQVSWSAASCVGLSAVDLRATAFQPRPSQSGAFVLRILGQMRVRWAVPAPPQSSARWAPFLPSLKQTFAEVALKALGQCWVR